MLKVSLVTKGKLSEAQRIKLEASRSLFEEAINSIEFRQEVLNYWHTVWTSTGRLWWKKWYSREVLGFRECSLTNQQVYNSLMAGAETLSPEKDQEADIRVEIEAGPRGVIGWTNPHTPIQWISSWFFNSSQTGTAEIAGNLSHEWCHKLGYDHAFNYYDGREDTVPYAIGTIIEKLAQKIQNGQKLTKIP